MYSTTKKIETQFTIILVFFFLYDIWYICLQVASEINLVSSSSCVVCEWQFSTVFSNQHLRACVAVWQIIWKFVFHPWSSLIRCFFEIWLRFAKVCISEHVQIASMGVKPCWIAAGENWWTVPLLGDDRWNWWPGEYPKLESGGVASRNRLKPSIYRGIFNCHVWSCAIKMVPPN